MQIPGTMTSKLFWKAPHQKELRQPPQWDSTLQRVLFYILSFSGNNVFGFGFQFLKPKCQSSRVMGVVNNEWEGPPGKGRDHHFELFFPIIPQQTGHWCQPKFYLATLAGSNLWGSFLCSVFKVLILFSLFSFLPIIWGAVNRRPSCLWTHCF